MDAEVFGAGLAAAGAVEAGHGLAATGVEGLAEDVSAAGFDGFCRWHRCGLSIPLSLERCETKVREIVRVERVEWRWTELNA